jgi:hypothetical protein
VSGGIPFRISNQKTPILFFLKAWSNRPDHAFFMRQLGLFRNPKRQRGTASLTLRVTSKRARPSILVSFTGRDDLVSSFACIGGSENRVSSDHS